MLYFSTKENDQATACEPFKLLYIIVLSAYSVLLTYPGGEVRNAHILSMHRL